jgi:hypothetical protein
MLSITGNGGRECRRSNTYGRSEVIRLLFCKRCALLSMIVLAALCAACAGGGAGFQAANSGLPSAAAADKTEGAADGAILAAKQGDFALYVLPESKELAQQAGLISLSVTPQGQEIIVTANVSGAAGLRGICAELIYPSETYSPVSASCGALLGGADEQLSLCVTDEPGVAELGAVLKNCEQRAGFSGAGELARVRFARRPFAGARRVSSVPVWDAAKARLALDVTSARLEWECLMPGDYTEDGKVNIGDVTPLGAYWMQRGLTETYSYPDPRARLFEFDAQANIDGNKNGMLDWQDCLYLGFHMREKITEYRIYHSPNPTADMPDSNAAPSKIPWAGRVDYAGKIYDPVTGRRYMSIIIPNPTPGDAYWIRPSDGVNEGTPSNYAWYDTSLKDAFSLKVEPVTYIFGGTASFNKTVYTQEENIILALHARDVKDLGCFSLDVTFDPGAYDFHYDTGTQKAIPSLPEDTMQTLAEAYGMINCALIPNVKPDSIMFSGNHFELANCRFTRETQTYNVNLPTHGGFHDGLHDGYYVDRPSISFDPSTGTLNWLYAASGDTNQDGMVINDDLILLSYYWNQMIPFAFDGAEIMADCNHNGVIGVDDQSPISATLFSITTGYYVYASSDPSAVPVLDGYAGGPSPVAPIGYVSFTEAQGDPLVDRLRFSANIGPQPSGTYLWVMPEYKGKVGMTYQGEYVLVP